MYRWLNVVKFSLVAGGLLCLSAVGVGAFGAHALSELLSQNSRTAVFELANRYHFYHGLALMLLGLVNSQFAIKSKLAPFLMLIGTVIFSGSLYLLAIMNIAWLGAITPIGGVCLLLSWLLFVWSTLRFVNQESAGNDWTSLDTEKRLND